MRPRRRRSDSSRHVVARRPARPASSLIDLGRRAYRLRVSQPSRSCAQRPSKPLPAACPPPPRWCSGKGTSVFKVGGKMFRAGRRLHRSRQRRLHVQDLEHGLSAPDRAAAWHGRRRIWHARQMGATGRQQRACPTPSSRPISTGPHRADRWHKLTRKSRKAARARSPVSARQPPSRLVEDHPTAISETAP